VIVYSKRFWVYTRNILFVIYKSHKKALLIQKYVTLHSYVNICFKSLFKIMSFSSPLRIIYDFFQGVKTL